MGNSDSQDSPRLGLGGSHHLPPYSILYASSWCLDPNDILSRDSQMGVSKFPNLGLSRFWGPITLRADLQLRWGLKQSCNPRWKILNGMLHVTCTQGNQVDFWLLVVGSQTANLTLYPSFGHNLCFRCLNGSWKIILNIYVSISFQWYKELFNLLGFDPFNRSLNIGSPPGLQLPR
jgi:hypothetical protein